MFRASHRLIVLVKLSERPAADIARRVGITPSTPSRILNGHHQVNPGTPKMRRLARVLGLTPSQAFAQAGRPRRARRRKGDSAKATAGELPELAPAP